MTRISLTFKVPPAEVEKLLFDELSILLAAFSKATYKKIPLINSQVKNLTREIFRQGVMNQGLVNGDLAGHFGIPAENILDTADRIIDIIVDNVYVTFYNYRLEGRKISGRLVVEISPNVINDLISADFAEIVTEKGDILPWINWSLFEGDSVIIEDYSIFLHIGSGRSGMAIMKKDNVGFWKVPSEVSGTETDNWITREVRRYRDVYLDLVQKSLSEIFDSVV